MKISLFNSSAFLEVRWLLTFSPEIYYISSILLPTFIHVCLLFFLISSPQIKVSVAQGHVHTPSPKPRFKSYVYTQTAYVMSSDQKGRMFPPQVCQYYFFVVNNTLLLICLCLLWEINAPFLLVSILIFSDILLRVFCVIWVSQLFLP